MLNQKDLLLKKLDRLVNIELEMKILMIDDGNSFNDKNNKYLKKRKKDTISEDEENDKEDNYGFKKANKQPNTNIKKNNENTEKIDRMDIIESYKSDNESKHYKLKKKSKSKEKNKDIIKEKFKKNQMME